MMMPAAATEFARTVEVKFEGTRWGGTISPRQWGGGWK